MLWQHSPSSPVGTAADIARYPDRIAARIDFAAERISATADEVCGLVKAGIVSSVSVGFDIIDAEPLDPKKPRGGLHITRWELQEISFVSISADTGAGVTARHHRRDGTPSRAEVLLAAGRGHVKGALDFHRDISRCLDRGDIGAADYPHRQQLFPIRAADDALDEAADLPLASHRADELLARACRHIRKARDDHQRLGDAIDRHRAADCESAHGDLGRSLRGVNRALRDIGTESPVVPPVDADLVAKLQPTGGPRGGPHLVAQVRAEEFARVMAGAAAIRCLGDPPSYAERQVALRRLRR